jgi:F-type H+-transporting ATPase subunit b
MRARITAFLPVALLLAPAASASEAAHEHAGGPALAPLLFSAINLAIFIWIIARYAMPQVRRFVRQRRDQVVQALQEAAAAKAEALELRTQWEQRLAQFEQEVQAMQARARQDAEQERERILAAAGKAAESIRRDAERTAAYEIRRTQEQVRAELVRQAVELAADAARTQLTPADQQRFVADFLKQVGS